MRKSRSRLCLFIFALAALLLTAVYGIHQDVNGVLGMDTLTQEEWAQITKTRKKQDAPLTMSFEGQEIPYIHNLDAYLITQSVHTLQWQGTLSASEPYLLKCLVPQGEKREIIADGTPLQLLAYNDQSYVQLQVIASGLPVICMEKETIGYTGFDGTGRLTVMENNSLGRENVIEAREFAINFRKRGDSSRFTEKVAWKLNLRDRNGGPRSESLLGMNPDNDWALNAMFIDDSNIRDKLVYDFWELMGGGNLHDVQYCEFVCDGAYMGLYLLMEHVDEDTYDMGGNNSFVYSAKSWPWYFEEHHLYDEDALDWMIQGGGEIDEFSVDVVPRGQEQLAVDLLGAIKAQANGVSLEFPYEFIFDEQNSLRYAVLLDLAQAWDNRYKNQKFMIRDDTGSRYLVQRTPWDLDITMMNNNMPNSNGTLDMHMEDLLLPAHIRESDAYRQGAADIYWACREKFYYPEALNAMIDGYYETLNATGAVEREKERWGEMDMLEGCAHLKAYFPQRIEVLDAYYGGQ